MFPAFPVEMPFFFFKRITFNFHSHNTSVSNMDVFKNLVIDQVSLVFSLLCLGNLKAQCAKFSKKRRESITLTILGLISECQIHLPGYCGYTVVQYSHQLEANLLLMQISVIVNV